MQDIIENLKEGKIEYLSYRQIEQLKALVKTASAKYIKIYFDECFVRRIDPNDIERSTYECYMKENYEDFLKKKLGPEIQKANLEALQKHAKREANEKRKEERRAQNSLPETIELTPLIMDALNMIRKVNPIFQNADNQTVLLFSLGFAAGAMKREDEEMRKKNGA